MSQLIEAIQKQIQMLNEGLVLEAFDLYFADYGVMHSNGELFGTGIAECRKKQEPFISTARNVKGEVSDLVIDEKSEFCVFRNTTRFDDSDGNRQKIDGLHVQMWAGGQIVIEWYFNGELMHEIISAGIFSDPAHILELL
ncbi:MAG: hypothetical protein AB3N28_03970 [Kordiimonas sp.]